MSLRSLLSGWMGEAQTSLGQAFLLEKNTYVPINNLTVNAPDGSTQIDHVIVSPFGIFVVESKRMRGWIFGNEKDPQWTQSLYGKKFQFQNPLRQNYRHIKVLSDLLKLPEAQFHSIVVFWGDVELKTALPPQVLTKGYTAYIKSKTEPLLGASSVAKIVTTLQSVALPKSWKTRSDHIGGLKSRLEAAPSCPQCGSRLVLRTSNSGYRSGSKFYGCSSYPKCRYIRDSAPDA